MPRHIARGTLVLVFDGRVALPAAATDDFDADVADWATDHGASEQVISPTAAAGHVTFDVIAVPRPGSLMHNNGDNDHG